MASTPGLFKMPCRCVWSMSKQHCPCLLNSPIGSASVLLRRPLKPRVRSILPAFYLHRYLERESLPFCPPLLGSSVLFWQRCFCGFESSHHFARECQGPKPSAPLLLCFLLLFAAAVAVPQKLLAELGVAPLMGALVTFKEGVESRLLDSCATTSPSFQVTFSKVRRVSKVVPVKLPA